MKNLKLIGLVAQLTKKQTDRFYFSKIPIGTKFIIIDIHDNLPAYDLTGKFLDYPPQILDDGTAHYNGYIEKGSWELVEINEEHFENCFEELQMIKE